MIKKFVPYILIAVILVQLFAPFTVDMGRNNNLEVQTNKAEAFSLLGFLDGQNSLGIKATVSAASTSTKIEIKVDVDWGANNNSGNSTIDITRYLYDSVKADEPDWKYYEEAAITKGSVVDSKQSYTGLFSGLQPDTTYRFNVILQNSNTNLLQDLANTAKNLTYGYMTGNPGTLANTGILRNAEPYQIRTQPVTYTSQTFVPQQIENANMQNDAAILPECRSDFWNTVGGCIGIALYRLAFQPSAYIFAVTGKLLDYTFFYTIQDTSYRSQFVVEGWGIVRDFCNMFFIFILLYIAIGTILNLSSVKTKEMIINVVIIGLLINFSLFATQVIIDASNVLTRVFYNQILVGNKDANGVVNEKLGFGGAKQLTVALINKINPQSLIINAKDIGNIQAKGVSNTGGDTNVSKNGVDNATFIMVTILASIMNIVGLWTFLMVSLVFIARVIGLWLAMILAPIAFFSYTIPQMQDQEMIGWKKWWPETLRLAFLAPVFIFFLYLIIQFLEVGLGILFDNANNKSGLDFFIAIIVPFAFLMILLTKAKDITMKMSGEIGKTITNTAKTAAGVVGGFALGAATGGLAVLGRRTLGRGALNTLEGETGAQLREKATHKDFGGFMARQQLKVLGGASKASFDARKTKAGGALSKATGMNLESAKGIGLGSKEGGWEKTKEDVATKRQKRADQLKVGKNENLNKTLRQNQEDLADIKRLTNAELTKVQKGLDAARQKLSDEQKGSDGSVAALKKIADAKRDVDGYVDEMKDIKEATGAHTGLKVNGKTYKQADTAVIKSENDIASENADRLNAEADRLRGKGGSINEEAAHRIRSGAEKEENKKK